jgi:hypothetical protein
MVLELIVDGAERITRVWSSSLGFGRPAVYEKLTPQNP